MDILTLPPFTVTGRHTERNFIPIELLTDRLEVVIDLTDPTVVLRPGSTLQLLWNDAPIGALVTINDVTQRIYTLFFETADFPPHDPNPVVGSDVTGTLDYVLVDGQNFDESYSIAPLQVRFDRRRPGGTVLPPVALTPEQQVRITEDDLVGGQLPLAIGAYARIELFDNPQIWIGTDPADLTSGNWIADTDQRVTDVDLGAVINAPRSALEAAGDGPRYIRYRVFDESGNLSVISQPVEVNVGLQTVEILPPVVPEAADGLVTYSDANAAVQVNILRYANAAPAIAGDIFELQWGGQRFTHTVVAGQEGNDPLWTFDVPLASVRAQGNGAVVVSWLMRRNNVPTLPAQVTVQVDLRTPGGEDLTPGDPVHSNLRPPVFVCNGGPDNTVRAADYGQDGTVTVPHLGATDNAVIWQAGDRVQLHWQSIADPEVRMPPRDILVGGENADITDYGVPFDTVIGVTGVGTFELWYTVTRTLLAGPPAVTETSESPRVRVVVASGASLPGGGTLAHVRVPRCDTGDADDELGERNNNMITRRMMQPGPLSGRLPVPAPQPTTVVFRIPLAGVSNIELASNPRYYYDFVGYTLDPADTTIVHPTSPTDTPTVGLGAVIEGSRVQVPVAAAIPLTPNDLSRGFIDVPVPYANRINLICTGFASIDYGLITDVGATDAERRWIYCAVNIAGGVCPIN
ncbi:hypothetical protein ACIPZF_08430 [Pseudomonas sp. NPDC089752]|uniref:hypothetical protein n=1 Tax=Pseudomonas sp. NPDC089752 TaxID=3364472 RepID=UPI00381DD1FA